MGGREDWTPEELFWLRICCSFHTKSWDSVEEEERSKSLRDSASFSTLVSSDLISVFSTSSELSWSHLVLKPPGQPSLWVLYWHRVGPDDDSVWSLGSLWHTPQTMMTGYCYAAVCLSWILLRCCLCVLLAMMTQ